MNNVSSGGFRQNPGYRRFGDRTPRPRYQQDRPEGQYREYAPIKVVYTPKEQTEVRFSVKDVNNTVCRLAHDQGWEVKPEWLIPDLGNSTELIYTMPGLNDAVDFIIREHNLPVKHARQPVQR